VTCAANPITKANVRKSATPEALQATELFRQVASNPQQHRIR
jgi:hypothetical protein